jgi:hypothetical protein
MIGGTLDGATLVNETFDAHVEMKTTFALLAIFKVLLHDDNFFVAQFTVYVEVKASNGLDAIHTVFHNISPKRVL